jgi:hypothetical protein
MAPNLPSMVIQAVVPTGCTQTESVDLREVRSCVNSTRHGTGVHDVEATVAPELRDAIRCPPGSCVLHIDPSRLPTATSRADTAVGGHSVRSVEAKRAAQDGAANLRERPAEARATARAAGGHTEAALSRLLPRAGPRDA